MNPSFTLRCKAMGPKRPCSHLSGFYRRNRLQDLENLHTSNPGIRAENSSHKSIEPIRVTYHRDVGWSSNDFRGGHIRLPKLNKQLKIDYSLRLSIDKCNNSG